MSKTSRNTNAANILIIKMTSRLPVTAAQCGRFFVGGLLCFWLLLVLLWLVPAHHVLSPLIKWLWLGCFAVTLSSYLLLLLQRIGISVLKDD